MRKFKNLRKTVQSENGRIYEKPLIPLEGLCQSQSQFLKFCKITNSSISLRCNSRKIVILIMSILDFKCNSEMSKMCIRKYDSGVVVLMFGPSYIFNRYISTSEDRMDHPHWTPSIIGGRGGIPFPTAGGPEKIRRVGVRAVTV